MVLTAALLAVVTLASCSSEPQRDETGYLAAMRATGAVDGWSDAKVLDVLGDPSCEILAGYDDVTEALGEAAPEGFPDTAGMVLAARHLCPEYWPAVEPLVID